MNLNELRGQLQSLLSNAEVDARCPVQKLIDSVREDDEEAAGLVEQLVLNTQIPIAHVVEAIRSSGLKTSTEAVSWHRRGICRCSRASSG